MITPQESDQKFLDAMKVHRGVNNGVATGRLVTVSSNAPSTSFQPMLDDPPPVPAKFTPEQRNFIMKTFQNPRAEVGIPPSPPDNIWKDSPIVVDMKNQIILNSRKLVKLMGKRYVENVDKRVQDVILSYKPNLLITK